MANIGRRKFFKDGVLNPPLLAGLLSVTITISCADDDDFQDAAAPGTSNSGPKGNSSGPGTSEPTPLDTVAGTISLNHGHTVEATAIDVVTSTGGSTLLLTLGNDHTHTVTLTAAQVENVFNGFVVTVTSTSVLFHSHIVTFN